MSFSVIGLFSDNRSLRDREQLHLPENKKVRTGARTEKCILRFVTTQNFQPAIKQAHENRAYIFSRKNALNFIMGY